MASTVKKKKCVAVKQSTSSMCPATMFIRSRRVSVIGRRMKVERNSSGDQQDVSGHGTPGRTSEFLKNLQAVLADAGVDERDVRDDARISGRPMSAVLGDLQARDDAGEVHDRGSGRRSSSGSAGSAGRPSRRACRTTMLLRTKPRHVLERGLAARRGRASCRRVPSQKITTSDDDDEHADQHDPVELERRADEQQDRREELVDRRAVESAI